MDVFNNFTYGNSANNDLSNLTPTGKQNIINIAKSSTSIGTVSSVNSVGPDVGGNVSINADNIASGVTNKYFTNTALTNELKTILTNTGDILVRDSNGNITRFSLSTNGKVLSITNNNLSWETPITMNVFNVNTVTDMNNLTTMHTGDICLVANPATTYIYITNTWTILTNLSSYLVSVNNIAGTGGNCSITTTNIPEGTQLYFSQTRFNVELGMFYQNVGDLLIRKALNNELSALAIGTAGQFLRVNNGLPEWQTVNFSTNLSQLGDVELDNLLNSQLLQYNNISGKWENKTVSYSSTLAGCTDVLFGTLSDQDIIRYDNASSKWKNYNLSLKNNLSELNDTNIIAIADREVVWYNLDTNKWLNHRLVLTDISLSQGVTGVQIVNETGAGLIRSLVAGANITLTSNTSTITIDSAAGGKNNLSELLDCQINTPTAAQLLQYTGNNKWENKTVSYAVTNLTDVTITNIQNDDILIYNTGQAKYINSQRFKTIETNYNDTIPKINQQVLNVTVENPTTYNINYNNDLQTNFPIIRSTYTNVNQWLPLNNGADATGDNLFLRMTIPSGGRNYFANINNSQTLKSEFYRGIGWGIDGNTIVRAYGDFTGDCAIYNNTVNNGFIFNVNLSQHNLVANDSYRLYVVHPRNNDADHDIRLYGLKNIGLINAEMANEVIPTVGADWDLITTLTVQGTQATVQNIQFTCAANYFLCRAIQFTGGWITMGSCGIWTNTALPSTNTLTIPDNATITNSANGLTVTNLNTAKTDESWALSLSSVISYYITQTVSKVVRGINSIFLNNTQISDSWIRVTNTNNDYKIENSTGTQNYITCNGSRGLIVPLNRSNVFWFDSDATPYNGADLVVQIAQLGTYAQVLPTIISNTQYGSTSFVLQNANDIICSVGGTYHITCTIIAQMGFTSELYVRLGKTNGNWLTGAYAVSQCNNEYHTFTMHTISTYAANEFLRIFITKQLGPVPQNVSIMYYTLTIINMLNS